ncbi:MAG: histidinol-phosphatase [Actinomycetes bacterium]
MTSKTYEADLALAQLMADRSDAITMDRFHARDLVVETKPDLTPVSDADKGVERALRELIEVERPEDGVLGEEYGELRSSSGRRWIVDPVDGTKNFVRGVPVWATIIGLQDANGDMVVGVVSAPALGRRWWAAKGGGAFVTEPGSATPRQIHVSRVAQLSDASLGYSEVVWTPEHKQAQWDQLIRGVWRVRGYGDFYSHLLVAEGAVDIAVEPELNLHDIAGLSIIVTEAGGRFSGVDGIDGPDRGSGVSSNGLLHDSVIAALA